MPLYYITGGSGTGKSTVLKELRKLGYETFDVDEAGPVTAKWHNINTGYIHPKSSVKAHMRTPKFLNEHVWQVSRYEVEELAKKAEKNIIFLGGAIANLDKVSDLFEAIFALIVDEDTLKHRLLTRTGNDWGKSVHELQMALDWNKVAVASHTDKGHIIVDSSQPIEKVTDDILMYTHGS